jgi:hypothetical protein
VGASTRMFELLDREPAIPLRKPNAEATAAGDGAGAGAGAGASGAADGAAASSEQRQSPEPGSPAVSLEGLVELESVCFAYPSRPDVTVLREFSLTVRPNTTVALVGQRSVSAIGRPVSQWVHCRAGQLVVRSGWACVLLVWKDWTGLTCGCFACWLACLLVQCS